LKIVVNIWWNEEGKGQKGGREGGREGMSGTKGGGKWDEGGKK